MAAITIRRILLRGIIVSPLLITAAAAAAATAPPKLSVLLAVVYERKMEAHSLAE